MNIRKLYIEIPNELNEQINYFHIAYANSLAGRSRGSFPQAVLRLIEHGLKHKQEIMPTPQAHQCSCETA